MLTTNLGIASWGQIFDDPTVAVAMLDRLLHRSVVFSINGESYRMRAHRARSDNLRRGGQRHRHQLVSAPPHPAGQLGRFDDRLWGKSAIAGNGPEFIAAAVADWCRFNGVGSVFIDPGSPWQNAWVESFNGRLRDEFLNGWSFDNLREAQVLIEDWRIDYNQHRPHSAHGELTPTEFAQAWTTRHQPALA